jgi:hypothetical protein
MSRDAENDVVELRDKRLVGEFPSQLRKKVKALGSVQSHPNNHVRPSTSMKDIASYNVAVTNAVQVFPFGTNKGVFGIPQDFHRMPLAFQIPGGLGHTVKRNPGDLRYNESDL